MRAEIINPFLRAASEVLESELGSQPQRGAIGLQRWAYISNEVTAVVAVTGEVAGMVLFAMTESTASDGLENEAGFTSQWRRRCSSSGAAAIHRAA